MTKTIDYFYSHLSPWSYLGHQRLIEIANQAGREILFTPIDSAAVFAASGGLPLNKRPVQRRNYRIAELKRWREALNLDLLLQPKHHPGPDKASALLAIAAQEAGADLSTFSLALMKELWVKDNDLSDERVLGDVAAQHGFDGHALLNQSQSRDVVARLAENTERAIMAEIFGMPWYIVDGEPFWGQDRLDFLAKKLSVV